jgi:phosphoglycerate dehydrogenase-like enzyme
VKRLAILDDYQDVVRTLPYWKPLTGRIEIQAFTDTCPTEDALAARLQAFEAAVVIRERSRFTGSLLARLPRLEHIAMTGRNTGHVDVGTATARGVLVTATAGSGPAAIEHTMALMLALVRQVVQDDRALREGRWQTTVGTELGGKTLGIVGFGRIGSRIAAFGNFLGMRVLAWSRSLTDEKAAAAKVTRVALDDVFSQSDMVSLHLSLVPETRGIVTARHLALMKPTAYLVNTARGPLLDEPALVTALTERRIAGAALDVFDEEPLPKNHPLLTLPNVVLTPHLGYVTLENYHAFFRQAAENILAWVDGKVPERALNPEVLARR